MPTYIEGLGQQLGGSTAGGILGLALGGLQNQQQYKQAEKMQGLNKQMIDYQKMKELEMWKNTGPVGMMEQLIKAGLNPALIYGMSGAGGGTTGGTGGGNNTAAVNPTAGMGMQMGAQMGLLQAQKENIEADTEKKKVETTKTAGVDTTEAQGRIRGLELNNEFLKKSLNDRLDIINTQTGIAIEELIQSQTQTGLDRATVIQKANIIKTQAIGEILKNGLIEAQTKGTNQNIEESKKKIELASAEIEKIANQILQEWTKLEQSGRQLQLNGIKEMIDQIYKANTVFGVPVQSHNTAEMAEYIRDIMKEHRINKK